jgi:hypothetical protein
LVEAVKPRSGTDRFRQSEVSSPACFYSTGRGLPAFEDLPMAFNPFHTFRKYQRPLIAALAIFCMIMFVASSGLGGRGGDAIYQIMGLFGVTRGKGNLVATLHGRKVTEGDLAELRRDRELASGFLFEVVQRGAAEKLLRMQKDIEDNQKNKDAPPPNPEISRTVGLWSFILRQGMGQIPRRNLHEFAKESLRNVQQQAMLMRTLRPENMKTFDDLSRVLAFEMWFTDPIRNPKSYYFGGTADPADLLDFILWEQQADRLGVTVTETDVLNALDHESGDLGLFASPRATLNVEPLAMQYIAASGSSTRGATLDQLLHALIREFRFTMTQDVIIGTEGGARAARPQNELPQIPAVGTPRDFLEWFRERRTTLRVAVQPVPVSKFLEQVTKTPSEATLTDFYEAYKGVVPAPDKMAVGFKEARRVRVETVSARPDSDFYKKAARDEIAANLAAPLFAAPFGHVSPAAFTQVMDSERISAAYSNYAGEIRSDVARGCAVPFDFTDRRPLFSTVAALTIGATPGALLTAASTANAEDTVYRLGLAKVAGSLLPAGAGAQPLAAIGLPFPYEDRVLPFNEVQDLVLSKVIAEQAPALVNKKLDDFVTELGKLKNRPAEAEAYVAKSIKEFGLSHSIMAEPANAYQLDSDPGLQGLKSLVDRETITETRSGPDTPLSLLVTSGIGVYEPQRYPPGRFSFVNEPYVWWRVKDLPAHERSFGQIRSEVAQSWRFEQARNLAAAEAECIAAAVKKNVEANKSAAEAVKVLRSFSPTLGPDFELNDVARLLPVSTPDAGQGQPYVAYSVPVDRIKYPRPDFVDRLMTLKQPGDVVVVRDRPAATLYVCVLQERSDPIGSLSSPNLTAFLEEYRNADKDGSLWKQQFLPEQRRAYIRQVEEQMRRDATGGNVDSQGNIILPDGIRAAESESSE